MKRFSDIRKRKSQSEPHVVGLGEWYFTYEADEDPFPDLNAAGGIVDSTGQRTVGGGPVFPKYWGRVSTLPDTEDVLKIVQDKLRLRGWKGGVIKLRGEILSDPDWGDTSCDIGVSEPARQITLFCQCGTRTTHDLKTEPEDIDGTQLTCAGCKRSWTIKPT